MKKTKLGWIGLGNMGIPMSFNLLKAGYDITLYNRTASKAEKLVEQGAELAKSISELISKTEIIFTMISDDAAVEQIYLKEILGKEPIKGKLFINMSTVAPSTTKKVAQLYKEAGAGYLDAPVSGSVKPAQDATLVIVAGGSKEDFDTAKPILDKLGKLTLHLGENGAGSAAKLAINYFLALTVEGFAETLLFAQDNGISKENMAAIVNASACGSDITRIKTSSVLKNEFPAAFALKLMAKDVRLAREQGVNYPLSESLNSTYQSALSNGLGGEDVMAIIKELEK